MSTATTDLAHGSQITDQEWTARLRAHDLRVTNPRLAVLSVLMDNPHADAEFIARTVRENLGKVSTQAIYDVLGALTSAGLVRRIEPAGHAARYEVRVGDNHHHMVCRQCCLVHDVDCAAGRRPCLTPGGENLLEGFIVDEAEVVYWGTCAQCHQNAE